MQELHPTTARPIEAHQDPAAHMDEGLGLHDSNLGFLSAAKNAISSTFENGWRKLGTYVAAGSLALGATATLETASTEAFASQNTPTAHESQASPIPNAVDLVKAERQKAKNENPGMNFISPSDQEIPKELALAVSQAHEDMIKKIRIKRQKAKNTYKVNITQENAVASVTAALLQDPADTMGEHLKSDYLAIDGDILVKKDVRVTPLYRTIKGKFKKLGRTVHLKNWDNFDSATAAYSLGTTAYPPKGKMHNGAVNVKAPYLTKKMIKSGRFYIDITQSCKLRDPLYDKSNFTCKTEKGWRYRVNGKKAVTTYFDGGSPKPGAVLGHSEKVKG